MAGGRAGSHVSSAGAGYGLSVEPQLRVTVAGRDTACTACLTQPLPSTSKYVWLIRPGSHQPAWSLQESLSTETWDNVTMWGCNPNVLLWETTMNNSTALTAKDGVWIPGEETRVLSSALKLKRGNIKQTVIVGKGM